MGEFYSGVNIVGMVKETIEVFFRLGGRRGRDRMVIGFTTSCAISAYHH
jgi:hypothetical protein